MSTCVPFVFKPVELKKTVNNKTKIYNIVDGGVLDKIPFWLIDSTAPYPPAVCFTLDGGEKKSLLNTSMDIFKDLVASIHDIGGPEKAQNNIAYTGKIDTSKIGFLDFNLSEEEKLYLYNSGKKTAIEVFNTLEQVYESKMPDIYDEMNAEKHYQDVERLDIIHKQKSGFYNKQLASILLLFILLYLKKY